MFMFSPPKIRISRFSKAQLLMGPLGVPLFIPYSLRGSIGAYWPCPVPIDLPRYGKLAQLQVGLQNQNKLHAHSRGQGENETSPASEPDVSNLEMQGLRPPQTPLLFF